VNFKVLYIGRGNDVIFTYFLAAFVTRVAFKMESGVMNKYKWLISNDRGFSEPRACNVFMAKVHTRYFWLLGRSSHVEKYKVLGVITWFMPML
jgi:hypothetical protein